MNRLPILAAIAALALTPAALAADAKPARSAAAPAPAPAPNTAPAPVPGPVRDMTHGACVMAKPGGQLNCIMTDQATCEMEQGYSSTEYYPGDSCISRID